MPAFAAAQKICGGVRFGRADEIIPRLRPSGFAQGRLERRPTEAEVRVFVCNRNCPQAASMSWPFSRRKVAGILSVRRIDKNLSCRWRDGRDHGKPSTVLYGIRFTFAESLRACFARRCA